MYILVTLYTHTYVIYVQQQKKRNKNERDQGGVHGHHWGEEKLEK